MSILSEKINSYALEKGMILGGSLSFPEPETGSYPQTTISDWTVSGVAGQQSVGGPRGQQPDDFGQRQSLKFVMSAGNRARLNFSSTNFGQAFVDHSFSMGFWFKINDYTYANNIVTPFFGVFPLTQGGFSISHNTSTTGTSRIMVINTNSQNLVLPTGVALDQIPQNQWHYVAFVRTGSTMDVYFNGAYKMTMTGMITATQPTNLAFGGASLAGTSPNYVDYNLSNFYVAPVSVIGPAEIEQIWNAGNTAKIINYYNGTTFKQSSALTVWNGTSWSTTPPTQYYNGTSWVNIPEYDQAQV